MNCCGIDYPPSTLHCQTCGRIPIFDGASIKQERWRKAVETVSMGGLYFFTQSQLFAEFLDEKTSKVEIYRLTLLLFIFSHLSMPNMGIIIATLTGLGLFFFPVSRHDLGIAIMFVLFFLLGLYFSIGLWGVLGLPLFVLGTICLRYTPKQLLSFPEFQQLSQVWFQVHPNQKALMSSLCANNRVPHGARALLVVDQDILVDFFVRNGFFLHEDIAVISSRFIADVSLSVSVPVYFLHGSGAHVQTVRERDAMIDIGWKEEDLQDHPSFQEFTRWDQLPVDLLSPKELLEATAYAIHHQQSILRYFDATTEPVLL